MRRLRTTLINAGLGLSLLLNAAVMADSPIPYSSDVRYLDESEVAPAPEKVDAKQLLKQMRADKNPYGEALVLQNLASQAVKKQNYGEALDYLEQCVASGGLAGPALDEVRGYLADLALAADSNAAIVKYLEPELKRSNSKEAEQWMRVAYAHYQLNDLKSALAPLQSAKKFAKPLPDDWLKLEIVIHQKLGNEKQELAALKELTGYEPVQMKRFGDLRPGDQIQR